MRRIAAVVTTVVLLSTGGMTAQEKRATPPAAPAKAAQPRPSERPAETVTLGQPVNIRLELTVVDDGGNTPSRKTVTLTVADRQSGSVRAVVVVPEVGDVPLYVDALPIIQRDGHIQARITLEYKPNPGAEKRTPQMRLSFGILLDDGKKIVAAQAADPTTDRKVSVEVTATVLR